jgi:hypothetical protein
MVRIHLSPARSLSAAYRPRARLTRNVRRAGVLLRDGDLGRPRARLDLRLGPSADFVPLFRGRAGPDSFIRSTRKETPCVLTLRR